MMTFCEDVDEKKLERWKYGNLKLGEAVEDFNLFLEFVFVRIKELQEMIKETEEELNNNNDNDKFLKNKINYAKLDIAKIKEQVDALYLLL